MATPLLACMALVAALNQVPPRALAAIAAVEGGQPGQASRNRDGTEDLGPMQVNTRWLPTIAAAMGATVENARTRLLSDPCFNVSAGAAILRTYLAETRGNLLQAVGDYHSHTPLLNQAYQARVLGAARRMFAPASDARPISFTPVR